VGIAGVGKGGEGVGEGGEGVGKGCERVGKGCERGGKGCERVGTGCERVGKGWAHASSVARYGSRGDCNMMNLSDNKEAIMHWLKARRIRY
jgi:hypothetical protein